MNKLTTLFWLVCIPSRLVFAVVVKFIPVRYLPLLTVVVVPVALTFFVKFMTFDPTVSLGAFGQVVWWNRMRLLHAIVWGTVGAMSLTLSTYTYSGLLFDVLIGIWGWFALK
jgi:hypothetical protein